MAQRGLCSRREADRLISEGKVYVDGELAPPTGMMVDEDVKISLSEGGKGELESKVTVILNKPRGLVSHLPEEDQEEASVLLRADRYRGELRGKALDQLCKKMDSLSVAGRLDRSSRGMLIFSNDGVVAKHLTMGGHHFKKYLVKPKELATAKQVKELNSMRRLLHWNILPMEVYPAPNERLVFVLNEGKKHQIREACYAVGLEVSDLYRVQMGPIELGPLAEGCWRELSSDEREDVVAGPID
jgi:23S rRNA pseudouridine2604 synthase